MSEKPLRGYPGIDTSDGYFYLPRAYFGLVRAGLAPGPILLATYYLYLDGFEKSGRISCPDTRAADELGKCRRTIQNWKADLVAARLVECQAGSKYLDVSGLKEELKITAEIQRMPDMVDAGGHLRTPRKRAQDVAQVESEGAQESAQVEDVDNSEGAQDVAQVSEDEKGKVRKNLHSRCATSGAEGAQDSVPLIRNKKAVRKDSVKQPASPAARTGPDRTGSPLIDKSGWNARALSHLQDHQGDRVAALAAYLDETTGNGVPADAAGEIFEIAAGRYEKLLAQKH